MLTTFMDESVSILLVASLLALLAVTIVKDNQLWRKGLYVAALAVSLWSYFTTGGETLSLPGAIVAIVIGLLAGWILSKPKEITQK